MAKTYGYGIQAFTSGLGGGFNIGMQILEMKKEKKAREELKKAEEKTKELFNTFVTNYQSKIDDFANLPMSERYSINMAMYQFSKEYGDLYKQANDALDKKDFEAFEQVNELINTKIDHDLEVGIKYGETIDPKYFESPMTTTPFTPEQLEGFKTRGFYDVSPAGVQERIAPGVAEKMGLDLEFQPEKPTVSIKDYNDAWNHLMHWANVTPEAFNRKKTNFQSQFPDVDIAGITQEALKSGVKGVDTLLPTSTSVENIRGDIRNAPTLEDAKRIHKNHIAKYGETLDIPDVDKFWSDEKLKRLTLVKGYIDKLLVDRGDKGKWLKPGIITSAELDFEIEDDEQKVETVYKDLREDYMSWREMLEKMGIDVSQFPELKALEEIEKVGGTEGFFGLGIQKGHYKGIYK